MSSVLPPVGFASGVVPISPPGPGLLELYLSVGADAIEVHLRPNFMFDDRWVMGLKPLLAEFRWVSIHAPDTSRDERPLVIERIRELAAAWNVGRVTVHPTPDFQPEDFAQPNGLFAIENMDRQKTTGRSPGFFQILEKETDLHFVLDLQHCFEHDPSMALAGEFADIMGQRLSHLHVSGEDVGRIHAPVSEADNAEAILATVAQLARPVPIIIEGERPSPVFHSTELRQDLEMVRAMLSYIRED